MPWARRAPEKQGSDEDAELRDLMKEYSRVHRHSNAQAKEESEALTAKLSLNPFKNLTNQSTTPSKTKTESPANELIQGQAISYTRKEALLYANEEPCDTWRHFDEWFHHHLPLHMGSDYYRYGYRRSPVPYWDELRFCTSTKSMPPLEAKIAIGRRRHEKLARLRQQGSSEDFWEIRKEPIKNPFPLGNNNDVKAMEKDKTLL